MPKFEVSINTGFEVEAENYDEAYKKAEEVCAKLSEKEPEMDFEVDDVIQVK